MVTELIRAVNHFTGKFHRKEDTEKQPIKLEKLATGAANNMDPDQTGLIRAHNVCFHGNVVHLYLLLT